MAVVARLLVLRQRRFAHGFEFFAGFVGVIRLAGGNQVDRHFAITWQPVGLVNRAFVVVQAEPIHRQQNGVNRFLGAALAVGIFDPQDELPAATARFQIAIQGGAGTANMQETGRAGSEAGTAGHARWATNRERVILHERTPILRCCAVAGKMPACAFPADSSLSSFWA